MKKNKFYVVWAGRQTGIFDKWNECKTQIDGFAGARYKAFESLVEAQNAFENGFTGFTSKTKSPASRSLNTTEKPIQQAIAVDAACSGNPGNMEYRGVFVQTGEEIFKSPIYEGGTNNIGEFLAIVHCLAWQQKNNLVFPIYSDSVNGIKWVSMKVCNTKLVETSNNKALFEVIRRAELWLRNNSFRLPIYKWKTEIWGEVPADFGRK